MCTRGIAVVVFLFGLCSLEEARSDIDLVLVDKSDREMYLMSGEMVKYTFKVALGDDPLGHKAMEGDEKTPEGTYKLDYKNSQSRYYRSIHVSYPDNSDKKNAKALGVHPGGDIMIHGQPNGYGWAAPALQLFDWTDGCIAVTNDEMDIVWDVVSVGTTIKIRP